MFECICARHVKKASKKAKREEFCVASQKNVFFAGRKISFSPSTKSNEDFYWKCSLIKDKIEKDMAVNTLTKAKPAHQ